MIDPNVLNYFLVILGGFGVVWSFRHFNGRKQINEFEYAAFSALWGIPVILFYFYVFKDRQDLINAAFEVPMTATPTLFIMGLVAGTVAARIWNYIPTRFKGSS